MQKQQAGHYVLLTLVTILTFVLLVASETNQNVALDARDIAVSEKILPAGEVRVLDKSWMHVALIMSNYERTTRKENNITVELQVIGILDREGGQVVRNETKLANYFQRLVTSILLHSTATPIHLIVLTEQESLAAIRRDLKNQIGRHLSTSIIRRPTPDIVNFVHLFPKIRTDFVSLSSIVEPHRKEIDRMKQHFGHHMPVGTKFKNKDGITFVPSFKYTLDLFYILPFYHIEFPVGLSRLMVLDVDIEVLCDLRKLWQHFQHFSPTQVMGVGLDQSPHYFSISSKYREANPETNIGQAGDLTQGVNTGVALYSLAAMRASKEFKQQACAESQASLAEEFMLQGTVGDQDWVTLLAWHQPQLVYQLPCQFNVQTDQVYNTEKWADVWKDYRNCPNRTMIRHDNGE